MISQYTLSILRSLGISTVAASENAANTRVFAAKNLVVTVKRTNPLYAPRVSSRHFRDIEAYLLKIAHAGERQWNEYKNTRAAIICILSAIESSCEIKYEELLERLKQEYPVIEHYHVPVIHNE